MDSQLSQYIPGSHIAPCRCRLRGWRADDFRPGWFRRQTHKAKTPPTSAAKTDWRRRIALLREIYLVAMLFILFDIEVVFMYPWAVVYREMLADHELHLVLGSMISFLVIYSSATLRAQEKNAFEFGSLNPPQRPEARVSENKIEFVFAPLRLNFYDLN